MCARAHAAGSLTIGMWDHWVPGANEVQTAIINEWAEAEKVDVKIDYITSQGNKLMLTLAAEELAKSGHDIMEFTNWEAAAARNLARAHRRRHEAGAGAQRPDRSVGRISRQMEGRAGSRCR